MIALLMRGGGQKEELNEKIKEWWKICREEEISATYEKIPREENKEADKLSKVNEINNDRNNMTEQAVEKAVRFANKHRHADFITPMWVVRVNGKRWR